MSICLRSVLGFVFLVTAAEAGATTRDMAQRDALADFYGNTLVCRDRGIESHFYYRPDHTFSGKVPAYYMVFKGTWYQASDGTVCRVFDPPLPTLKNPDCGPLFVHRIGEKDHEPDGHAEKLMAGIQ